MNEVVIYPSQRKMFLLALGSALFVAFGIYCAIFPLGAVTKFGWIAVIAGYVALPFFGFCFGYGIYRLVKPTPAIIINRDGIFDNASAVGAGFLHWTEIAKIMPYMFMNQHFLGIIPVDAEEAIARLPWFKRHLIRMNKGLGVTPFNIPQQTIAMPLEELLQIIRKFRRAHNNRQARMRRQQAKQIPG